MNSFTNANEFLGEIQPESLSCALTRFFNATASIREKLGDKQTLLTEYLETVFDAISKTNIETSATLGFSNCARELREVCVNVMSGDNKNTQHPFYQTAKRYIDTHPLQFEDNQSKIEAYTIALKGSFNKYAAEKFYKEFSGKLENGHIARITELYKELCGILGTEEPIEHLNAIIKKDFIIVPVMASFAQGIIDAAVLSLLYQEPETGKYVFEMPLDIEA